MGQLLFGFSDSLNIWVPGGASMPSSSSPASAAPIEITVTRTVPIPPERALPTSAPSKGRWSKPLEWWVSRQVFQALNYAGMLAPKRAPTPIGRALGLLAYSGMPRYRKVAIANLRRAYGDEWDEAALQDLARQSFQNLGITLAEFCLQMPRLTLESARREVHFEGKQYFEEALSRGKGVVLVSAHYGNWELIGPRLAAEGYCVNGISRKADDAGMDRLITNIRTRHCRQIPRAQAAREGLAALRRNEVLAIGLDQNTAKGGIFVPFFGHPASTATGPAVFALKTGAAMIPTFCIREPNGDHVVKAWPPVYPCPTGERAADIQRLTGEMTQVIEAQIRQRPELWMWLHNRWKHQPTPE